MLLTILLVACSEKSTDETGATDGGSAECTPINAGEWAWRGQCPQMTTPVVIAVAGCALTLDYDAVGGMTMGMPYAGTLGIDTVVFEDGDSVDGCVGDILGPDEIEGSCDGGCTFTLNQ